MRGLFIFGSSLTFLEVFYFYFCLVSEKKSEEVFERKRDGSLIFLVFADLSHNSIIRVSY